MHREIGCISVHGSTALPCQFGLVYSRVSISNQAHFGALTSHSIKDKLGSGEINVTGDRWPIFLYANCEYDPSDPWNGLLWNSILVSVSCFYSCCMINYLTTGGI